MNPGMRQINAACKICRQPIVIEADIACPIEWVHKLTAMIVCDNCAAKVRRYCDDHPKTITSRKPINVGKHIDQHRKDIYE